MKTARIWAVLLALLTVSMLGGCSLEAMLEEGQTTETERLVLGTAADYAPFEFHAVVGGQDTIVGADIELAKKIADDMGRELVIREVTFEDLLDELNKGTVDLVISDMVATDSRLKTADASNTYYSEDFQRVVILKKNAEVYTDFAALAGAELAVQKGSVQAEIAKAHLQEAVAVEIQSVDDILYRLAAGEVDAALLAGDVAQSYAAENQGLFVMEQEFPESEGCSVWVAKGDPKGLLEQINKTIDYVKLNNLYTGWLEQATGLNQ